MKANYPRFSKHTAVAALVLATAVTASYAGSVPRGASSPAPASAPARTSGVVSLAAGNPSLLQTTFSSNTFGTVPFGAGFVAVDGPKTLTCPPTGGVCRIEAEQMVQVTGGPGGNNRWAICTRVDGILMDRPSCPFQGVVNSTIFQTGNGRQHAVGIAAGPHTVQTFLFSEGGVTRGIFSIDYHIYQ